LKSWGIGNAVRPHSQITLPSQRLTQLVITRAEGSYQAPRSAHAPLPHPKPRALPPQRSQTPARRSLRIAEDYPATRTVSQRTTPFSKGQPNQPSAAIFGRPAPHFSTAVNMRPVPLPVTSPETWLLGGWPLRMPSRQSHARNLPRSGRPLSFLTAQNTTRGCTPPQAGIAANRSRKRRFEIG
jgi:hypothetical protein